MSSNGSSPRTSLRSRDDTRKGFEQLRVDHKQQVGPTLVVLRDVLGLLGALSALSAPRRRTKRLSERRLTQSSSRSSLVLVRHLFEPTSRMVGALILVAFASVLWAANALAFRSAPPTKSDTDLPTLTVSDLGQRLVPVEVGQPALTARPIGNCARPFALRFKSACPEGTWPGLGGTWSPVVPVAGGDTLRLAFSRAVSAVTVASTSNWKPGQFTPSHEPIRNYEVLGPMSATSTSDPTAWLITIPSLNDQATNGYSFSVVARIGSGYRDYRLSIRTPRVANCEAYYNAEQTLYACGVATPP